MTSTQSNHRRRYAITGTGSRAHMYFEAICGAHSDVAELVALCDANQGRLNYFDSLVRERAGQAAAVPTQPAVPAQYGPEQFEQMISEQRVDSVIVTTPDFTHADFITRAMRAGADVVVEKPLTISAEGCRAITTATAETGRSLIMTFNYRYSPRNSALKKVIQDGSIGRVTSVHFEWVLDTSHGADYFRRWHRYKDRSGGLLVHKSSHHFDLVNWWLSDVPTRIYASGGLRFYGADNAAARGLSPAPAKGRDAPEDPYQLDFGHDAKLSALYLANEQYDGYVRDENVFSEGITIEDNLAVLVDYAGGATLTYSLNAHSPWEGYRVAVNGTEGRAELEVVERGALPLEADGKHVVDPSAVAAAEGENELRPRSERLLLQRHWEKAVDVPIASGVGGHGGGDAILLRDVFCGPQEDPLARPAGYRDGLKSVAVGISANESLRTGRPVSVSDVDLGERIL